ncbi:fimbrial protein [Serratia fonticola]|uniref:fimbrial protein n=1 Tax=Serratia fonticola TaxID=47917 RepID=UPI00192C2D39|nr:fimbrial protein [Serratia fonticola]MBL5904473.1 type 1 fimbrial protein [Serratia fonticola]
MKNTLISLAAIGCGLLSSGAFASDGTITINGQVTNITCAINVNGQSGGDYELTLPTVSELSLKSGNTAGANLLAIQVKGCTSSKSELPSGVRAAFENTNVNPSTGNLLNTTAPGGATLGATNVEIQLTNSSKLPINLITNVNNVATPIDVNGDATMNYYVQYIAPSADAIAGKVTTSAVYSLDYE